MTRITLTQRNHASRLRIFQAWHAARYGSGAPVTRSDALQYVAWLTQRYKPNTVSAHIYSLRVCWPTTDNPWRDVRPRRAARPAPAGLSRTEMHRLWRTCEIHALPRERAALALMMFAGLRVGEVAGLTVGDVQVRPRSGTALVRAAKHHSSREVPLNATVRAALGGILDRPAADSLIGIGARQLMRVVSRLAHMAGVQATAHTLRHTCAHRLIEAGAGIELVADVLGHARLESTRRYTRPTASDLQDAVERI